MADAPFRPKPMPKGWKNPLRVPLYRVVVDWRGQPHPVAVTPGVTKDVAEEFKAAVSAMIIKGRETEWANPSVVLCHL